MTYNEHTRRRFLQVAGAAGVVAIAGCVSDADTEPESNGTNEPATEPADEGGLPPAEPVDVETIAADPTDVPDPVDWDEPRRHEWRLETIEAVAEIEPGVTIRYMTYDGQVPGPMFRCRVGDTVHLTFDVPDEHNVDIHNVDFHAVYGPGGGAIDTTIAPGEGEVEIEFQATYPGAHIYHCAPGNHDQHISLGMFGTILVEPEEGLPEVDREFYLGQHELYTNGDTGEEGHHTFDFGASADEDPTYVLFNGEVARFTANGAGGPLHAEVGERVRVFWCNGGPNLVAGPHPIGNVWSEWYRDGDVLSDPARYIEGTALPAGVTAFGHMDLEVPGPIHLVDHALSRVVHKGLLATIDVEGEPNEEIFNPNP
ncbi:copper-containing nitrite reductase [Natronobiforma cellulositropha]|uniref:copper-containing nitrite reductase n=1 Tax=Natronobiforma cellulositropha TaxID=1679076 RepID=UPI0021D5BF72|nr:copper-containing nitrite reductase [Natronobiforma cellulositropha]